MALGYLVFCLAAGILWTDARATESGLGDRVAFDPPGGAAVWIYSIVCAVGCAWVIGLLGAPRAARNSGDAPRRWGRSRLFWAPKPEPRSRSTALSSPFPATLLAALLAGSIAFDLGSERLGDLLHEARRDRGRAIEASRQGPRLAEARVSSRRSTSWGDEVELFDVRAADAGAVLPERLVLRLARESSLDAASKTRGNTLLWPGEEVRLGLRITPLHAQRNPGSIDREHQWARRGIAARARLADPNWVVCLAPTRSVGSPIFARLARWRAEKRAAIGMALATSGDTYGLARALSTGDRTGLAPGVADDFRKLGVSHLLAVSGLHIGMVAGLLGWLGLRAIVWFRPRPIDPFPWVFLIAALGAGAYAWLAGGSVSVLRAWGCLLVIGLLGWMRRAPRPFDLLSGIALLLCAREPAVLFELGAQLSFAACLGIVLAGIWRSPLAGRADATDSASPGTRSFAARVRTPLLASLRVSCAASFGTAWVLARHGMQTAWLAPIANALAVPWTALVVLPASLAAALAASLADTLGLGTPGDGEFLFAAAWRPMLSGLMWPADVLVEATAWSAARLPRLLSFGIGGGLFIGAATTAGLIAIRGGRTKLVIVCWALLVVTSVSPLLEELEDSGFSLTPRVWFFDVGQGDAALIEGRQASILIDTGPGMPDGNGGRSLVASLRALGRSRLDLLVVTHADLDHRGGARRVVEGFDVAALWLPETGRGDPNLESLVRVAQRRGTRVSWRVAQATPEVLGDLRIGVLWPPAGGVLRSRNAGSLVLRVLVGGGSFLFLADVDAAIENGLRRDAPDRIHADYLKVSHHGSRGGSADSFLTAVGARHAVVSAPCLAGRGLPNAGTLDRIRRSKTRLWWTGRDGAIAVFPERKGQEDEVLAWAKTRPCPG